MAPRLSGQTYKFCGVSSLLGIVRQKRLKKKLQFRPESLGSISELIDISNVAYYTCTCRIYESSNLAESLTCLATVKGRLFILTSISVNVFTLQKRQSCTSDRAFHTVKNVQQKLYFTNLDAKVQRNM